MKSPFQFAAGCVAVTLLSGCAPDVPAAGRYLWLTKQELFAPDGSGGPEVRTEGRVFVLPLAASHFGFPIFPDSESAHQLRAHPIALLTMLGAMEEETPNGDAVDVHTPVAMLSVQWQKSTASNQAPVARDEWVELAIDSSPIMSQPRNGTLVGQSHHGDQFEVLEHRGDWLGIALFSGEIRYLRDQGTKPARPTKSRISSATLKHAADAVERAETRATEEATKRYQNGTDEEIAWERLLADRYRLKALRDNGLSTAAWEQVLNFGT